MPNTTQSISAPHVLFACLPWLSLILCTALFAYWPQLDIDFSRLFYDAERGFFWGDVPLIEWIYESVTYLLAITLVVLIISLIAILANRPRGARKQWRAWLFMVLLLLVGPGLLVNALLKDQWHRARPRALELFGGEASFSAPWVISNQCESNCSFVSGHASMGFYFLGLAFVATRHRRYWFVAGVLLGGMIGLVRIMQGGHFLSDVIFSFFTVYIAARLLHWLLYRNPKATTASAA